jgi:DNA primase
LGKDPDELVRNNPELWRETIKKPQHILDYYFQTVLRNCDLSKIENKKQVREKLLPYIFNIPDPLEKNHFLSKLSNLLDLTIEELNDFVHYYPKEIKQTKTSIISTAKTPATTNPKNVVFHLIALIVAHPQKIWGKASLPNISIKDQKLNQIYQELRTLHNHQTSHQEVLNKLKITGEEVIEELFLLADKDYGDLDEPEIQNELLRLVEWLNNYTIRVKRNKIIKELRTAEQMQDGERIKKLVEMLDKLK